MGTLETCESTCRELARIGVSEIACLLDFGPDTEDILHKNLPNLARLHQQLNQTRTSDVALDGMPQ